VLWEKFLHEKINVLRNQKGLKDAQADIVDADVLISLTDRPSEKVSKHFEGLNINWSFAELEMERWADQLCPHQETQQSRNTTAATKQSGGSSRTQKVPSELGAFRAEPSSSYVADALDMIKSCRCENRNVQIEDISVTLSQDWQAPCRSITGYLSA
jgi:hypothetical protein